MESTFWEYPKIQEWLQNSSKDKDEFLKIFNEIHGKFNEGLVDKTLKVLDKTLLKLYDGVHLETPYGFDLKELSEKNHIVLVPNHQSHADYIALTYMFYKTFKTPVYVAGGINLNIFLFGSFFRNTGAFFIRRRFKDDDKYKIGFEAYIYALLKTNKIVEFFFEGGRSRTGKLLPPRFGLFHMLLEAHSKINDEKPLMFIPVSIAHEFVPEEKAHARELEGGKKVKEKPTQVLKIFKLFNKKLGTIHIKFGDGITVDGFNDKRSKAQELAFECFKAVGNGMPVTPTSLLALILLDAPSGVITWDEIEEKAFSIIAFCKRFNIPLTPSLAESDQTSKYNLNKALNILVKNNKIKIIQSENLGDVYFSIRPEERVHILYFKNMILHHFLVPALVSNAWYHLKHDNFKSVHAFRKFILLKRDELKFEFYLPSANEMFQFALEIIRYATGKNVEKLEECFDLNAEELDQIAKKVSPFSTGLSYIHECYYLAASTIEHLSKKEFNTQQFIDIYKELYNIELTHGRIVQYSESFLIPIIKNTISYFSHIQCLERLEEDLFKVVDIGKALEAKENFARDLSINVVMNFRIKQGIQE